MRKFTKQIAALIASAAVGTAAGVGTFSVSSEEPVSTADSIPATTLSPTEEFPTTAGVPLLPDDMIGSEPTDPEELPPVEGKVMPEDPTDPTEPDTIPPLAGDIMPPDPTNSEELPPVDGELMPPDPTDPEELPPLAGVDMPVYGDINGDGRFDEDDVKTLQKVLLNESDAPTLSYYDMIAAADLYPDDTIDVYDLGLMKQKLMKQNLD